MAAGQFHSGTLRLSSSTRQGHGREPPTFEGHPGGSGQEFLGYYVYIIKEQPDNSARVSFRRFSDTHSPPNSSSSKIPSHRVTFTRFRTLPRWQSASTPAPLQHEGKGATWMFEDVYAKSQNCKKFTYHADELSGAVRTAVEWAEAFSKQFAAYQKQVLPWLH